jgi:hypothetical protein
MTLRGILRLSLLSVVILATVGSKCRRDEGPTGSGGPPRPSISRIEPAEAGAGEEVTIQGDNFLLDSLPVRVTFRDTTAVIGTVTNTSIRATVPAIRSGDALVVVRVGNRVTEPASFRVRQVPPLITSVSPNPVRAGDTLTIGGTNLAGALAAGLTPAATPQVLIDARVIEPHRITTQELEVAVPIDLPLGQHTLKIRIDGLESNAVPFGSEIFDATGSWAVRVRITSTTCDFGGAVGLEAGLPFALLDQRPTLSGQINGRGVNGVISPQGAFTASGASGGSTLTFTGQLRVGPNNAPTIDGSIRLEFRDCQIDGTFTAASRWSTQRIPILNVFFDFRDIATGGAVPAGTYDLTAREQISDRVMGSVRVELQGTWLSGTDPPHIKTADGIFKTLFNVATIGALTSPRVGRAWLVPLISEQSVSLTGLDASFGVVGPRVFPPVDNRSTFATTPTVWAFDPPQLDIALGETELRPQGSGTTSLFGYRVCFFSALQPQPPAEAFAACP